jgi:AAA15 family ATPase/GTPase
MLKEIYIDNYRRMVNQKIQFSGTMLLAGKNGTGKTTLLELIYKLKRFIINNDNTGHINELVTVEDLPRWIKTEQGGGPVTHIELKFSTMGNEYLYILKIQYNLRETKCRIYSEKLSVDGSEIYYSALDMDSAKVLTDDKKEFRYGLDWSHSGLFVTRRVNSKIHEFLHAIESELYVFILDPNKSSENEIESDILNISGSNFSRWYSNALTQNIEVASEVLKSYKDFLINCQRAFIDKNTGEFTIEEGMSDNKGFEIKFSELSTGQKKLCIYYALFKMLPKGSVLFFDEFENHLSLGELQPLYDMVQEQQDKNDLQIILVSHHDKTINWYHDQAALFSLSGLPAHVKVDLCSNADTSLEEILTLS